MALKIGDVIDIQQVGVDTAEMEQRKTGFPGWDDRMTELMQKQNAGWVVSKVEDVAGLGEFFLIKHPKLGDSARTWRGEWLIHAEENVVTAGQFLKALLNR